MSVDITWPMSVFRFPGPLQKLGFKWTSDDMC